MEPVNSHPAPEFFKELCRTLEYREKAALITVISTEGSTPQKAGACLLVRGDGTAAGTLGGGCVENDLKALALEAMRGNKPAHTSEYVLNEAPSSQRGMVCGGRMLFFIDPLRHGGSTGIFREALATFSGGQGVVLCVLVKTGTGRKELAGSKLLLRRDGSKTGTLGNADWDSALFNAAQELLAGCESPCIFELGGGTECFAQAYCPPPLIAVMGGGHIAKALAPLAEMAGFRFSVVDDRPVFSSRGRFPRAESVSNADFAAGLSALSLRSEDFVVVATRGHRYDDVALDAAVRTPAAYVGLLSSRRKMAMIFSMLRKKGIPDERVFGIHAPVGLDLGGRTPEQIGISIIAEIMMERYGRSGVPLRKNPDTVKTVKTLCKS